MKKTITLSLAALLLAACAESQITSTDPPQVTISPTSSMTATKQPSPTSTSKPRNSPTHVPTFTPAAFEGDPENYRLKEWTDEDADQLVAQVSSYLDAIADDPLYSSVYGYAAYMHEFDYLSVALREALLRFPETELADKWQWDLGYSLAMGYVPAESTDAPELIQYANLIEVALNSGDVEIDDLAYWFEMHQCDPKLAVEEINEIPGYLSTHLVQIDNSHYVIIETTAGYQVHGLLSSLYFIRETGAKHQLADLTGDRIPELILDYTRSTCCTYFHTYHVYDLTVNPPKLYKFRTNLSNELEWLHGSDESSLSPLNRDASFSGFILEDTPTDPVMQPCTVRRYSTYRWSGEVFEWIASEYAILPPGKYDDEEICEFARGINPDPGETPIIIDALFEAGMGYDRVAAYRPAVFYRLGEYHARIGDVDRARQYFQDVMSFISGNDESISRWIQGADKFLRDFHESEDYYKVCKQVDICNTKVAMQQLGSVLSMQDIDVVIGTLTAHGVQVHAYGEFDFDGDGNPEIWITKQESGNPDYELWIVLHSPERSSVLYVDNLPTGRPSFTSYSGRYGQPIIQMGGETLFQLHTLEFTEIPFITLMQKDEIEETSEEYQMRLLDEAVEGLLKGDEPALSLATFQEIQKGTDCSQDNWCVKLDYFTGLAHELMGEENLAVEAYLTLWKQYPESVYTTMARMKLEQIQE